MLHRKPASRAILEANRLFKPAEPKPTEYAEGQKAFQDNRERLRSERLARTNAVAGDTSLQRRSS
ncbi:hypothetical protein LQG66_28410 [Bradyrhizobium ontarionense]|uniref:Uncharacterized protein n=1 Tax=Bradyrhizobium ontarionense TaxID=2898149 RepID=A0ABY3R7J7_9BRAD|nr:hypothetical protein [Bradyrhizobium sp. A19]UFZ03133.1 hypothetical protein LQG66_28410 [Bradyrhizobium sp. A19]